MFRTLIARGVVIAALTPVASLAAQHEGMPGMPQGAPGVNPQLVAACVQSQQQVMTAADGANRRLELARQTNQPAALRAAMDDLQSVLSSMRAQLAPCAEMQMAATPVAHDMANMPGMVNMPGHDAANTPASPVSAADPHAGHVMLNAAPAAAVPQAQPAAPRAQGQVATPPSTAPKMVMIMTATDPAKLQCPTKIDPKTAPKTTYRAKTYYFCSEKDRAEFLTAPDISLSMRPSL